MRVNAAEMPVAAIVRNLVLWRWGRAVDMLAGKAMNKVLLAVYPDYTVAKTALAFVGPQKAVIASALENNIFVKSKDITFGGSQRASAIRTAK